MVGVPGKSKGCSTCRRRKKGCGQERPSCRQCVASGYVCGGYQRDLTFVLHPTSKAVEKARFLPVHPAPPLSLLLPSLDRSAFLSQCQDLFFNSYLPSGRCRVQDTAILQVGFPTHWTETLPSYYGEEESLELAFTALSISRAGRSSQDLRLVREGTKMYGRALKSLQKALLDDSRRSTDQVLAACQLLGLYEGFERSAGKLEGWLSHAYGAAQLIELQGPQAFSTRPAHFLFVGSRVPIIYAALYKRKRTFLADEEWLTVPWFQLKRTGMDYIVDIVSRIPGLLEELDILRTELPLVAQSDALRVSREGLQTIRKMLATWFQRRKTNAAPIITDHQSTDTGDTYPFEYDLAFENHLFAGSHLMHCCANLVVLTSLVDIELALQNVGPRRSSIETNLATLHQEAVQYATSILQAIPYCLLPEMGDLGISLVTFPMYLAYDYFSKQNEVAICAWVMQLCNSTNHRGLRLHQWVGHSALKSMTVLGRAQKVIAVDEVLDDCRSDQYNSPTNITRFGSPQHLAQADALSDTARRAVIREKSESAASMGKSTGRRPYPRLTRPLIQGTSSTDNLDWDSITDSDQDLDLLSPGSNMSHDSGISANSRHSSPVTTSIPRYLAHMQIVNASKGEFTFVTEDPSEHYIISDKNG